jgi:hypothetical protein
MAVTVDLSTGPHPGSARRRPASSSCPHRAHDRRTWLRWGMQRPGSAVSPGCSGSRPAPSGRDSTTPRCPRAAPERRRTAIPRRRRSLPSSPARARSGSARTSTRYAPDMRSPGAPAPASPTRSSPGAKG